MEILGLGLQAIGHAVGACATAFGFVYTVGIISKTFLIFMDKGSEEQLKNWFKFWEKKGF